MEELATGYGLIEGPIWDPARGLIFSDVTNGGAYCLRGDGTIETVVSHRKGMGGMSAHADGGLVVSGRNVSYKPSGGGDTVVILEADSERGELGFNDLTTDAVGRIYVGSVAFRPVVDGETPRPGSLYMIDLDGAARRQAEGIELTNGLGVSPDGKRLYHSDSLSHAVWVYETHDDGSLGERVQFAHMGDGSTPDGLAVGEDGSVWVADARGGRVAVFNAGGTHREDISVPLPMVTSLCFGGEDLRSLYIVTGSRGAGRENAGTIYCSPTDVTGLQVPLARIDIGKGG